MIGKIKTAFFMPDMIIGGTENVFIRTLEELLKDDSFDLSVFLLEPLKEKFYTDWFGINPNIKLHIVYPAANRFRWRGILNFFPIKNIRKISWSIYKKIMRRRLKRDMAIKDFDIVIDYKNFSCIKELKHARCAKITWIHGGIDFFNRHFGERQIREYDRIVCLSDSFLRDFQSTHKSGREKIVRIYNPIDIGGIKKLSRELPAFPGKYFLSVSRLAADKDIETIIRAFDIFLRHEQCPEVKLLIVGDGKLRGKLERLAQSTHIKNNIIFTGSVSRPFGYMRGAMAHILSSRAEGLPTVMVESAVCGTLNIASDCKSGVAEILMDGDAGILFKPGDAERLAEIMSDILHERPDAQKLIGNAAGRLERFDSKAIIMQVKNLLADVMKNTGQ
ncbi:MAG: glycosyltransferase [Rickettsiales bacterium]|jgi:glycosyltransferase involved in cell wall biosynthesis|nr:glycosyltransferase [Rickettsiales bacterium]